MLLVALSLDDPQVQTILQNIVFAVISALGTVLVAAIGLGTRKVLKFLDGKAYAATFECAIKKIGTLTKNAVMEVEQTLVRQIKKDKKWDVDTAREARDTAVSIVERHLGENGMVELGNCLGLVRESLQGMLRTYVERHVNEMGSTNGESPIVAMGS